MPKRPKLSNLIYTDHQIVIHAFSLNTIHPGKFLFENLSNISFSKNLSLKLKKVTVGRFQKEIWHKDQNAIFLYFQNISPNINLDNYWAAMYLRPKIIQCPSCKAFYVKNDSPCECIKGAPFYVLVDCELDSVHLFSYKTDNDDSFDLRADLYSEFFNKSMHNLKFLEPI